MAKERLKSPRARLFVALDLPEEVRAGLAGWQASIDDPALRVVPAQNLHITLVFLGWQAEKDVDAIAEAAFGSGPAPRAPEVELLPEPVSRPERGRPRLFAIEGRSPGVEAIQAGVSDRLETACVYVPEKRPFWVHLTVARVKPERREGKRGKRGKPAVVETPPGPLPEQTFASFRPSRLVVFRSTLRPRGAVYEPMAELELPTAE